MYLEGGAGPWKPVPLEFSDDRGDPLEFSEDRGEEDPQGRLSRAGESRGDSFEALGERVLLAAKLSAKAFLVVASSALSWSISFKAAFSLCSASVAFFSIAVTAAGLGPSDFMTFPE